MYATSIAWSEFYIKHMIYMRITHDTYLPILTSLVLFIATTAHAADTTYAWTSADGDPYDLAGTIVLDSSSSAGGGKSDVLSINLSGAGFPAFNSVTYSSSAVVVYVDGYPDNTVINVATPFTWTPSQITSMGIYLVGPGNEPVAFDIGENSIVNEGEDGPFENDTDGSWVALPSSVPENMPAWPFLILSSVSVFCYRRFHRGMNPLA